MTYCYSASVVRFFIYYPKFDINSYLGLLAGISINIFVWWIQISTIKQNVEWLRIFSHEATHALFNILFFNRVIKFYAGNDDGGQVAYKGRDNFIISLSPYFFPLFTVIILIFRLLVKENLYIYIDILIGITYLFHLRTFILQFSPQQTDISTHGFLFSLTFILLMNIFFFGLIITVIGGGYDAFSNFLIDGFYIAASMFRKIFG